MCDLIQIVKLSWQRGDAIKILVRNMFYKKIQLFKELYNNYRDDHVIFINLIQSSGYIVFKENLIDAFILPTKNYRDKLKKIIKEILNDINKSEPTFPDNSGKKFKIDIEEKGDLNLRLQFYKNYNLLSPVDHYL